MVRRQEVGNGGVVVGVVQQGAGAGIAAAAVHESDASHRVLIIARNAPDPALDVDMVVAIKLFCQKKTERPHGDVDVGDLFDAERKGGQGFPGRQGDFHSEGVALHGRRPQDLGLPAFVEVFAGDHGEIPALAPLPRVPFGHVWGEEANLALRTQLGANARPHRQCSG